MHVGDIVRPDHFIGLDRCLTFPLLHGFGKLHFAENIACLLKPFTFAHFLNLTQPPFIFSKHL